MSPDLAHFFFSGSCSIIAYFFFRGPCPNIALFENLSHIIDFFFWGGGGEETNQGVKYAKIHYLCQCGYSGHFLGFVVWHIFELGFRFICTVLGPRGWGYFQGLSVATSSFPRSGNPGPLRLIPSHRGQEAGHAPGVSGRAGERPGQLPGGGAAGAEPAAAPGAAAGAAARASVQGGEHAGRRPRPDQLQLPPPPGRTWVGPGRAAAAAVLVLVLVLRSRRVRRHPDRGHPDGEVCAALQPVHAPLEVAADVHLNNQKKINNIAKKNFD